MKKYSTPVLRSYKVTASDIIATSPVAIFPNSSTDTVQSLDGDEFLF